jgi:hypothetical protein
MAGTVSEVFVTEQAFMESSPPKCYFQSFFKKKNDSVRNPHEAKTRPKKVEMDVASSLPQDSCSSNLNMV